MMNSYDLNNVIEELNSYIAELRTPFVIKLEYAMNKSTSYDLDIFVLRADSIPASLAISYETMVNCKELSLQTQIHQFVLDICLFVYTNKHIRNNSGIAQ